MCSNYFTFQDIYCLLIVAKYFLVYRYIRTTHLPFTYVPQEKKYLQEFLFVDGLYNVLN